MIGPGESHVMRRAITKSRGVATIKKRNPMSKSRRRVIRILSRRDVLCLSWRAYYTDSVVTSIRMIISIWGTPLLLRLSMVDRDMGYTVNIERVGGISRCSKERCQHIDSSMLNNQKMAG